MIRWIQKSIEYFSVDKSGKEDVEVKLVCFGKVMMTSDEARRELEERGLSSGHSSRVSRLQFSIFESMPKNSHNRHHRVGWAESAV